MQHLAVGAKLDVLDGGLLAHLVAMRLGRALRMAAMTTPQATMRKSCAVFYASGSVHPISFSTTSLCSDVHVHVLS